MIYVRAAIAAFVGTLLIASPAGTQEEMPRPDIPDGLSGFAGEMVGRVTRKYENGFLLEVAEVGRTWRHSRAPRPASAVGRTLLVNLRWEEAADGSWRVAPRQAAWLARCVEVGDRVRIDVANDEGARLHLMELEEEQRRALDAAGTEEPRDAPGAPPAPAGPDREPAAGPLPEPAIPDGLHGFSGTLAGEVRRVGDLGFVLRVAEVVNVWRANRAPRPESAVGRDLLVNVQWVEGAPGEWHPQETHVRWVATLSPGDRVRIEVVNDEGDRLHILELSREQRQAAQGE